MYHYTYIIQSKTTAMRYIGVRSSTCKPTEDITYWGSSKYLPDDVKDTHIKIVLKTHNSRKEAIEHEILLHNLNDVALNSNFYNRAKQTSIGFDTTGIKLSATHKAACSAALKGRVFTEEHKANISKGTLGKPKSKLHKKRCSIAQKKLASSASYVNPRKGSILLDSTKELLSVKMKNKWKCSSQYLLTPKFSPWFIYNFKNDFIDVFYTVTKSEHSILLGLRSTIVQDNCTRSKGSHTLKRGVFKGCIMGNIKDAFKVPPKIINNPWFIMHSTYSEVFYTTSKSDYALMCNIKVQTIHDSIHISKGRTKLKKGQFKDLVLGNIKI